MSKRNEKRPGYKKTVVGWVPEGWDIKPLGAFGEFSKGRGISNREKRREGLPCITYGEIYTEHDVVIKDFKSFIDPETAKISQRIKCNDILFAGSGETLDEIGKCAAYIKNIPAYAGGDIIIFTPNGVDSVYLSYSLNSDLIVRHRRKLGQGHSVVHIYPTGLKTLHVPLPSLPEQRQIAEILSTWDRAIEQVEKLVEEKKKQRHWLSCQLLAGRRRLQGFTKPWKEYRLGELFNERVETGYQHLHLLSITREEGVIPRNDTDRKDTSSADKSRYLRICPGDIGYNTMRMWQGVSALSSLEGIVSPAYTVCTPKKGVDGEYMAYFFKLPKTIHLFYRYSQGLTSDTWNLKFRHFKEIKVHVPEYEEQKEIVRIIRACDEEIRLWKNMVNLYRKQKCGLMQKLLTGEWRVKPDREAA
jgi:type I restriction enzyme S subunit